MKYKLLMADSAAQLETSVNELIAEGWQPWGGASVTEERGTMDGAEWFGELFAQAMVLHEQGPNMLFRLNKDGVLTRVQ